MIGYEELAAAVRRLNDERAVHEEHGREAVDTVLADAGVDPNAVVAIAREAARGAMEQFQVSGSQAVMAIAGAYGAGFELGLRIGLKQRGSA